LTIYQRLLARYGPQHWWPGDSPFEVIVGAILTQSAAWGNVEKALANLKGEGVLSPQGLYHLPEDRLAQLIYPSGYYNAKARKLKAFVGHLVEVYQGDLDRLLARDVAALRPELLALHGIGQETADSILLYAGAKPVFVIDAYTRRSAARLGLAPAQVSYAALQALFMESLPPQVPVFNEYHALLVRLGKEACRKLPRCPVCPLLELCPTGQAGDGTSAEVAASSGVKSSSRLEEEVDA
jgi:endonuclease-3 related protein